MANVLLTQRCVRACPYCFANKHMGDADPADVLSWENLVYLADFLESSGERQIALLGGEPTLHPHFPEFVLYLLERRFHVTVFTSGILSDAMLGRVTAALEDVDERLLFVCNINEERDGPPAETARLRAFLERMGPHASCGFNIHRTDFDLAFLVDLINRYGMRRGLRLGLTHPIPGRNNRCIAVEDIPAVVERIMSFVPLLERCGVVPTLDCGFPMCQFSDEQLGQLYRLSEQGCKFGCGPAIDIGPDMSVWSCFPLSNFHKRSVFEFDSFTELHRYYHELNMKIRVEMCGIYAQCDECVHRQRGRCSGGCAARALSHFAAEAPVRMAEMYA